MKRGVQWMIKPNLEKNNIRENQARLYKRYYDTQLLSIMIQTNIDQIQNTNTKTNYCKPLIIHKCEYTEFQIISTRFCFNFLLVHYHILWIQICLPVSVAMPRFFNK